MRREHKLKTWESLFLEVRAGRKTAEFRRNDRDFAVGDLLVLERFRPGIGVLGDGRYVSASGVDQPYSVDCDTIAALVTHVATGFGIPDGYCMLSFARVEPQP